MTAIDNLQDPQTKAFAVACYDTNSIDELRAATVADDIDMRHWGISEAQWYEAVRAALADMEADELDDE